MSASEKDLAKERLETEAEFENREKAEALVDQINESDVKPHTHFVKKRGEPLYRIYVRSVYDPTRMKKGGIVSLHPPARGEVQFWDELITLKQARKELRVMQQRLAADNALLPAGISVEAFISPDVTEDHRWRSDTERDASNAWFEKHVVDNYGEPPRKKAKV